MFWKTQVVETTSVVDLLDKDGVTLEEVLEDEFLLQELKCQNEKLVTFLSQAEHVSQLLRYSITDPGGDATDKKRFRMAHISSEVLTANVDAITTAVISLDETRNVISSFLNRDNPDSLNPLLASFYTKIMTQLLAKDNDSGKVLKLLESSPKYVEDLLKHLGTSSVMDLCFRFVTVPEKDEDSDAIKKWLCENKFPERLVCLFERGVDGDVGGNAASLWGELVRILRDIQYTKLEKTEDVLLNALQGRVCLESLLCKMFGGGESSTSSQSVIVNGCQVFTALLQTVYIPNSPRELAELANSANPPWKGGAPPGHPDFGKPAFAQCQQDEGGSEPMWSPDPDHITESCLAARLQDFHSYLQGPSSEVCGMSLPMGEVGNPLGAGRLAVVKLLSALLNTNHENTLNEIARLGTVKLILDLMFVYPWNNFLHTAVNQCILCVLFAGYQPPPTRKSGESEESEEETERPSRMSEAARKLIRNLITDNQLLQTIMKTHEKVGTKQCCRPQYVGHVMQLAGMFENAKLRGPNRDFIEGVLSDMEDGFKEKWEWFVESVLVPYERTNEPDNVEEEFHRAYRESEDDMMIEGIVTEGSFKFVDTDDEFKGITTTPQARQKQSMQSPGVADKFGMPMDTFTQLDRDELLDCLAKQEKSFKVEEVNDIMPPGESSFEALCNAKINTEWGEDPFADKNDSQRKNSWSSEEGEKDPNSMDVDPWATSMPTESGATTGQDNWADFGSFEAAPPSSAPAGADGWTADFGSVFGGGGSGRSLSPGGGDAAWCSSPVSQGIAVSTASTNFDWGIDMGSPKRDRERSRSGDKPKITVEKALTTEVPPAVVNGPAKT